MLSFFPRGVLDGILNLIESVSEGFPSYSCTIKYIKKIVSDIFFRYVMDAKLSVKVMFYFHVLRPQKFTGVFTTKACIFPQPLGPFSQISVILEIYFFRWVPEGVISVAHYSLLLIYRLTETVSLAISMLAKNQNVSNVLANNKRYGYNSMFFCHFFLKKGTFLFARFT